MKTTDVFDRLDNVLGNYAEGKATAEDVVKAAYEVNQYLNEHPHSHNAILTTDKTLLTRYENGKTAGDIAKEIRIPVGELGCPHCGITIYGTIIEPKCNWCDKDYWDAPDIKNE